MSNVLQFPIVGAPTKIEAPESTRSKGPFQPDPDASDALNIMAEFHYYMTDVLVHRSIAEAFRQPGEITGWPELQTDADRFDDIADALVEPLEKLRKLRESDELL